MRACVHVCVRGLVHSIVTSEGRSSTQHEAMTSPLSEERTSIEPPISLYCTWHLRCLAAASIDQITWRSWLNWCARSRDTGRCDNRRSHPMRSCNSKMMNKKVGEGYPIDHISRPPPPLSLLSISLNT